MAAVIRRYEITDEEWEQIILKNKQLAYGEGLPKIPGQCSTESFGFSGAEQPGGIFPKDMDPGRPCISDS